MKEIILRQNTKGLNKDIQEVGCFFVSCLAIAQLKTRTAFSLDQYNDLWDKANKAGYINNRNIIVSDKIINLALDEAYKMKRRERILDPMGSLRAEKLKAFEVGTDKGGFYGWVKPLKKFQAVDACIQKIRQETGASYPYHFRVTDKAGSVVFDPYSPSIKAAGSVHIIWYRILKG